MPLNPPVFLVAFPLDYSAHLLSVVFVTVRNMMLQPLNEEFFVLLLGDWFQFTKLLNAYLKLFQDMFKGPLGRVLELEGCTDPRKSLLLQLVVPSGGSLDNVALDPMKKVPPIHPSFDFLAERKWSHSFLAASVLTP